jgi:hypothetical protein
MQKGERLSTPALLLQHQKILVFNLNTEGEDLAFGEPLRVPDLLAIPVDVRGVDPLIPTRARLSI